MQDLQGKYQVIADDVLRYVAEKVAGEGIKALNMRDIATKANVSVGTIYNACGNIDDIIIQMNSRTLQRLDEKLTAVVDKTKSQRPADRLVALAYAYLEYVLENKNLWAAIFEHQMPSGTVLPDWHKEEHYGLIKHIYGPLSEVVNGLPEEVMALSRTIYSAVHGIVSLSINTRLDAVPLEVLKEQIDIVVRSFTIGYRIRKIRRKIADRDVEMVMDYIRQEES